jgi:hypothetical protein
MFSLKSDIKLAHLTSPPAQTQTQKDLCPIIHIYRLTCVYQMMYVSGETAEASAETTGMIEEIVRQQVIEMVCLMPNPVVILF